MTAAADLIPTWVDGRLVPFDKLAAHLEGRRHRAVSVFVLEGDRVLIQRRAMGKYHTPGLWANTCCTHPHWGEATVDCAVRRLREELGIEGVSPVFAEAVEYRADVGGGMVEHEVVDIFTAVATAVLPVAPDPAEVMEVRWVTLSDLDAEIAAGPERFTPWLRIYLADHRHRIFRAA
ncbi:MAG: isopentenyl-diphosphate Delta-isomerase [Rhodobacteraceae bacterium]|uniref:isopentenyl-diphosphate Delta-isomerase n=1 Tax=Albidovulum sp. TaxID=1872424 RepID=UPI001D3E3C87|nr:isopentenyl-diphosphate Delta-isomerase [uncultured Defluviimonas sp.]MCB2126852.1 isopentenyl-diphosphate Delta-isomerase [Paracoccaceae bacterium]MCC0070838.1 isopentenyl-diphosphate Delta-isomerase [Paracoccaceae bacterium]